MHRGIVEPRPRYVPAAGAAIGALAVVGQNLVDNWDWHMARLERLWHGLVMRIRWSVLQIGRALNTLGLMADENRHFRPVRPSGRVEDGSDRRAWRVHLTPAAEPAMRKLRKQAFELRRDALAGLSRAERERFVDALLAIKANLSRMQRNGGE
jgi:hypothetical protein